MLPPSRLTQLARDMVRPRGDRVLAYWSPRRPVSLRTQVKSVMSQAVDYFGDARRATMLTAAVALFALGILLPRPTSGFVTLAAYGLFMFAYHHNKPGSW